MATVKINRDQVLSTLNRAIDKYNNTYGVWYRVFLFRDGTAGIYEFLDENGSCSSSDIEATLLVLSGRPDARRPHRGTAEDALAETIYYIEEYGDTVQFI